MTHIIQCNWLRANFNDFRLLCDNYNPLVCCLQETMLTKDDFIIRGFKCGGVSVLVMLMFMIVQLHLIGSQAITG